MHSSLAPCLSAISLRGLPVERAAGAAAGLHELPVARFRVLHVQVLILHKFYAFSL